MFVLFAKLAWSHEELTGSVIASIKVNNPSPESADSKDLVHGIVMAVVFCGIYPFLFFSP